MTAREKKDKLNNNNKKPYRRIIGVNKMTYN